MREKYCPGLMTLTPFKRCALREGQERRITVWLRDRLAPFMHRRRFAIISLALALAVGAAVTCGMMLEPANKIPLFKKSHPFEEMLRIQWEEFHQNEDWKVEVGLVYGLQPTPIAYAATGQILPAEYDADDNKQQLLWDDGFDMTPAVQEAIVAHCDAAAADAELVPDGEVYCVLRELKAWLGDDGFPLADEKVLRSALEAFARSLEANATGLPEGGAETKSGWVGDGDGGIRAMWNTFNTTIPLGAVTGAVFGGNLEILGPWYPKWEAWVETHCSGVVRCYQTGPWVFMSLLQTLAEFAASTVAICLFAAFVVLLFITMNVAVAVIATGTVFVVIMTVVALVVLAGFKNGMYEAIFTIICVGMSIDYAVHLSHFYNNAVGTRYEKTRDAIHGVGVSVIGGAITTVVAAAPLLFCVFSFFKAEGIFIFTTSLSAILFSFILLIPLFMTIGPQGEQGDLQVLLRLCGFKKAPAGATKTQQATPATGTPDESFNEIAQKA